MKICFGPKIGLVYKYVKLFHERYRIPRHVAVNHIFMLELPFKREKWENISSQFNEIMNQFNIVEEVRETFLYICLVEYLEWVTVYNMFFEQYNYIKGFKELAKLIELLGSPTTVVNKITFDISKLKHDSKQRLNETISVDNEYINNLIKNSLCKIIDNPGFIPQLPGNLFEPFFNRKWSEIYKSNIRLPHWNQGQLTTLMLVKMLIFIENETSLAPNKKGIISRIECEILFAVGKIFEIFPSIKEDSDPQFIIRDYFKRYLIIDPLRKGEN